MFSGIEFFSGDVFYLLQSGNVRVFDGSLELVSGYLSWASVYLDYLASDYDVENLDFRVGSILAYPFFTSSGWAFKFFESGVRPPRDIVLNLRGDGSTVARYSESGQKILSLSVNWFDVYLDYLSSFCDVTEFNFKLFNYNFYRVKKGEAWDGFHYFLMLFADDATYLARARQVL